MAFILDILYSIIFILLCPKMFFRMYTQNRYKKGWSNRLGKISRNNPDKKSIWIHAVSVGEVNATKTIVELLQKKFADHEIVISTTTDTGYARAKSLYGDHIAVFYFPMDFSFVMKRAFKTLNPAVCLLMELEVWPNFASIAKKRNTPVLVVNGRLSERSFPRYKMIRPATGWMFNKITLFLTQTDEYANRFIELGVEPEKIIITSSVKYDTAELTDQIEGNAELSQKLNIENDLLWIAGGTGPNEEKIIIDVYKKLIRESKLGDLRLAIVPRKPERFDEVAKMITDEGFELIRYSKLKGSNKIEAVDRKAVILGDTMGDLRKFYSLATSVFVGRSLCQMGGSDMMESSAMGKFTCFGPYTFNFKQTVDALLKGNGAVEVADENELYSVTKKSLLDCDYNKTIAQNGQDVIRQNQGATQKTIDQIEKLIAN